MKNFIVCFLIYVWMLYRRKSVVISLDPVKIIGSTPLQKITNAAMSELGIAGVSEKTRGLVSSAVKCGMDVFDSTSTVGRASRLFTKIQDGRYHPSVVSSVMAGEPANMLTQVKKLIGMMKAGVDTVEITSCKTINVIADKKSAKFSAGVFITNGRSLFECLLDDATNGCKNFSEALNKSIEQYSGINKLMRPALGYLDTEVNTEESKRLINAATAAFVAVIPTDKTNKISVQGIDLMLQRAKNDQIGRLSGMVSEREYAKKLGEYTMGIHDKTWGPYSAAARKRAEDIAALQGEKVAHGLIGDGPKRSKLPKDIARILNP